MYYDLRTICYEGFLDFIFDHPVAAQFLGTNRNVDPHSTACWYDAVDLDIDFDPARNCEYFALLFCDSLELKKRYSRSQLEQGFWWMQTSFNDGSAADVLWTDSLPVERRVAMVEAMYFLCSEFFAAMPLGRAPHMWWENLASGIPGHVGGPNWWADRQRIENAMFQTLAKLLERDAENCHIDALHGLNHLAHPGKEPLIREYLARHAWLDEEHRLYAERAIAGALL